MNNRVTDEFIAELRPDEVFVFGSNLGGFHGGGAARAAFNKFGAVWGQGVGLQGQSYAIPTMQGGVETIKPYVDEFIRFAAGHPEKRFLVTPIGCGIAGFTAEEIAPLFADARGLENISLPESFWRVLDDEG
jgi:Protoheme ferro-lyase (ferrochelatase)